MAEVRIDVAGMSDVVRGVEDGIDTVRRARDSLRASLGRFDLDPSPTWALEGPVSWGAGELPGLRRRLSLAQALEGQDVTWPAGTVLLDESRVSTLEPAEATRLGRHVAAALRDGDVPLGADVVALLVTHHDDPYFASVLARGVTAEELADAVKAMSYARTGEKSADSWYSRAVVGLARTMGTATRATGELAMPRDSARQWVRQMTGEIRSAAFPQGSAVDQANALALLTTSGRWADDFMVEVTAGVVDYERAHPAGEVLWLSRGVAPVPHGTGVYDATGAKVLDPVSTLLSGLARRPSATQRLFTSGDQEHVRLGDQDLMVSARLRHLLLERSWQFDRVPGRAFSDVIEAATTTLRDRGEAGRVSAQLTTQVVALVGGHTGDGAQGGWSLSVSDPGWELPESLRPTMARLLASYAPDLLEAVAVDVGRLSEGAVLDRTTLGDAESDLLYGPGMPYGAVFDKDLLAPVLATLGKDREHFDVVLAGLALASNLRLTTALDQTLQIHPGAPADLITGRVDLPRISNTLISSSSTLGWVIKQGYGGAKAEEALKEERAQVFAETLSLAASFPGVPEVSKDDNVQWVFDKMVDEAIGRMGAVGGSEAPVNYGSIDAEAPIGAIDNFMILLLQRGYLSDEAILAANRIAGTDVYTAPPKSAMIPGSDPDRFDTNSLSYQRWLEAYGSRALIQNTIVDPYGSAWGNLK